MDEIKSYLTDNEEDQKLKPSARSANNTEKKRTEVEKAKNPEGKASAVSADNMEKKLPNNGEKAMEILKEVEKLLEHEPSIISADVIQNLQKIQAKLILKEVEEPKNLQKIQAKLILKDLEGCAEREPSMISADVIRNLENIRSQLKERSPKVEVKKHQRLHLDEDKLHPILKNLKVSYDNLIYESRICLLYLSIFPEDAVIKKRPIIYWWIANGLVKPISTGEKKKTAEEVGEDVFEELLQSHLIMAREENEISTVNKFGIHPWIRHMLINTARKANLFDFNPEGMLGHSNASSGHVCLPNTDGNSKKLVEHQQSSKRKTANSGPVSLEEEGHLKKPVEPGHSSEGKTANSGHVSLQEDGDSKKPAEQQQRRYYFKTIFNVGEKYLSLNPEWFAGKKLVAFQLGRWQAPPEHHIEVEKAALLSTALGTQKLLKYLSLRGILKITELSDSILGLTNLEILDLKACYNLKTLPGDISALTKLTHFDVSDCYLLEGMPKGLGKLSSLEALKGFIITGSKKTPTTRIGDLKSLQNLQRFSIYIGSEAEILQGEFEQLEHLKSVQRLKISWGVVSESKKGVQMMKEDFKLPTSLEKLTLEGLPHDKFPDWLKPSKLKKLKMLYIEGGNLRDLSHDESDHQWKVEILHLWYVIKSSETDLEINLRKTAKQYFPYLRCDPHSPEIKYRKEAAQSGS